MAARISLGVSLGRRPHTRRSTPSTAHLSSFRAAADRDDGTGRGTISFATYGRMPCRLIISNAFLAQWGHGGGSPSRRPASRPKPVGRGSLERTTERTAGVSRRPICGVAVRQEHQAPHGPGFVVGTESGAGRGQTASLPAAGLGRCLKPVQAKTVGQPHVFRNGLTRTMGTIQRKDSQRN